MVIYMVLIWFQEHIFKLFLHFLEFLEYLKWVKGGSRETFSFWIKRTLNAVGNDLLLCDIYLYFFLFYFVYRECYAVRFILQLVSFFVCLFPYSVETEGLPMLGEVKVWLLNCNYILMCLLLFFLIYKFLVW